MGTKFSTRVWVSVVGIASIFFGSKGYADTVISVADFGLKPDTRENAVAYVQKAIEACRGKEPVTLVFPEGRYDFWPQYAHEKNYYETNTYDVFPKRLAMLFEGLHNITVDGNGSQFVMHDRIQPITVENCDGVTLKNFSIDWDIPLTAQARVTKVGSDFFEIEINVLESPYIIEDGKLVFVGEGWKSALGSMIEFESDTHFVVPGTGDLVLGRNWRDYTAVSPRYGIVRLSRKGGFERYPAEGNWLVLRHSTRDHAGIFICGSHDVRLSDVQVYHTAGLGILAQYSSDIAFKKVSVEPNAAKGRILSGHDDGFHLMGCKGKITVDSCRWAGLMDDPINIHGTCVRVVKVLSSDKVVCRFMHDMSKGMEWGFPGDKVGMIENNTMRTVATANIRSFKAIDEYEFELELTSDLPEEIGVGAALENLTWTPDVDIRNSFFGSCRARGLLVSPPGKVVIENNVFESSGSAILIAGDANYWYESGAVKDVLIKGNDFRYPCMSSMYQFCEAIISIEPEIPQPDTKYPFHSNIRIENNTFNPFDYPILYAKSVDGISFTGNVIQRNTTYKPFHKRKAAVTLVKCRHAKIKDNKIIGDVLGAPGGKLSIVKE